MIGHKFMFATGIENSYPTIKLPNGTTKRVDEMAKTFHYEHWKTDFQLVKELGIKYLSYGPPYYSTHLDALLRYFNETNSFNTTKIFETVY